jgi:hypothetical protein
MPKSPFRRMTTRKEWACTECRQPMEAKTLCWFCNLWSLGGSVIRLCDACYERLGTEASSRLEQIGGGICRWR